MKKGQEKAQTDLNWVNQYLKNGNYPPGLTAIEKRIVRKRAEQFCFISDELYFLGTVKSKEIGQVPRKVLLTYEERWNAIQKAHVSQDGTHLGLERTLEPVTDKYYWVGIHRFARDYIRQCPICLDRNPRLGQGGLSVSGASLGESSYDDGSSIGGDDTLSISGTEVVSTAGDADSVYEHCPGFEREIAKSFWEMVDLRLYGPIRASQKNAYILMALDGYSLWPEAFILDTVSPSTIAQSILKLICRFGQMGKLVMSQDDEVLETATVKALDILKQEASLDLTVTKTIVENSGELYDAFEYLLEQFIASNPKAWAECIDFCLLPLRSSCPQGADYTPSFLTHSRELQLPSILVQSFSGDSHQSSSESTQLAEPYMTEEQKKMVVDMMMHINQAILKDNTTEVVVVKEEFVAPKDDKSTETDNTPKATSTPRAIVTRTRTGSVKPKHFDDESYITPSKRKASAPVQASESKKVKVELVGTVHNVEQPEAGRSTSKKDESMGKSSGEKAEEIPSDSETDLSTVAKPGTKITVDLDQFYKCIRQYVTNQTYLPNLSYKFKTLIREASKLYKLVGNDLFYKSGSSKEELKVIVSKEERLQLLEWAHLGTDKSHQGQEAMLGDLQDGQVHWKGKSFDCESFALACPGCENYEKRIKLALKNMQEEKKLIVYDTCDVYNEIRVFLRPNVFPDAGQAESLVGIKKYLNSFKIEGDQLMYITDMKKKKVVVSPAERMQIIAEAHLEGGKHQDVRSTLSKVMSGNFWFGMKIDVKVYVTYCCSVKDGQFLNDRYFMFRAYFMKKGPREQTGRVVRVRDQEEVQADVRREKAERTAAKSVDISGNIPDDVQPDDTVRDDVVREPEENERPSGIFVSTVGADSEAGPSSAGRAKSGARVTVLAVTENEPTEKGDMSSVQKGDMISGDRDPKTLQIVSGESEEPCIIVKLKEPDGQNETNKPNVVVEMNEAGDTLNVKLEKVLNSAKSQARITASDSDPVTMAAVKSILPVDAGAVANVLNEIEVGGEETSPSKINETSVEMRNNSGNASMDLVVNESDILDEETDENDEEEDGDDDDEDDTVDDSIEVPTSTIHSELLSRLTETMSPSANSQDGAQKKVVTPRQHFKCNICNRVFYGPNKFKTHIYRHTGQKPFSCSMCNKKYTNNKSLVIHERTHTGELPYLCNTCGKRMASKVSLKSHMKVHDGKGGGMPCKCDICGRDFTRRHLMERHRNFKHINLQTQFKCSECPKIFGHQRSLKRHFMSHHMGVKNHVCHLCGKAFYRKEYLTSHQVQHAGFPQELAKKKRVNKLNIHYVKEEEEQVEEDTRNEEEVRRIVLHQDEDGTLRVVDLATERQVKKMLQSQLGQQSQDGGTMVVQIQEPGSPSEHQVIQIEQQGSGIKQQVIEVQQPGGQVEQHVIEVEPGSEVKQTVVQVENDGQTQEVVEVPVEGESYIEYHHMEESSGNYITVGSQTSLPTSYPYSYTSSQADIAGQATQELIYGQPAVQYEVECVGEVGDDEALSAINLLAQASAAQYENAVSQI